jgi:hypothetical protein
VFEHVTDQQIDSYIRQRLPPAELLSLTDHLAECEACRGRIERALGGDLTFDALRSATLFELDDTAHPLPESMAAYVDGILSGEELQSLRDHLTQCDPCSMTAEDLRSFRDNVVFDRRYRPLTEERPERAWWWRWSPAFAIVIVLLVGAGWLVWRGEETPEVVRANPEYRRLPAGPDRGRQDAGGTPVAELFDGGGRITVDSQGRLSGVDQLPAAYQQMLKDALMSRRLEPSPLLSGLNRPGSALMSGSDPQSSFAVVEPVGTVSESDRPTFRWSALGDGATYSVEVYDEAFEAIAGSPRLSGREWTPQKPLERGRMYSWQVRAVKDGRELLAPRPPAPQAKFRILDSASARELDEARRAYPSSHLLLALLSARAGLLEESAKELRLLQEQNPDSAVIRGLLDQLPSPTSTKPAQ